MISKSFMFGSGSKHFKALCGFGKKRFFTVFNSGFLVVIFFIKFLIINKIIEYSYLFKLINIYFKLNLY